MLTIRGFDAPLGAEVIGLDLGKPLQEETFREIAEAFARYSVLVFREQEITPEQHIAFSRRFGQLEELKFYKQYLHPEHPEIFVVSNIVEDGKQLGLPDAGRVWHTDVSYKKQPSMGSLLLAREVPQEDGRPLGDTMFSSTCAAYDALPARKREQIDGLFASHRLDADRYERNQRTQQSRGPRAALTEEQRKMIESVVHPVARTHEVTGRKCIYVNELYTFDIVGLPQEGSRELLEELCEFATRPEFIYRHQWSVGDLLMWDNCATQHQAIGDYAWPQRRLMHRTTVAGGTPV